MLKKAGVLGLMLFGLVGAVAPTRAFAQDGYHYGRPSYYYRNDRDGDRYQRREWREHEQAERREDWRERRGREDDWQAQERWEYQRDRGYHPNAYFQYGYGR